MKVIIERYKPQKNFHYNYYYNPKRYRRRRTIIKDNDSFTPYTISKKFYEDLKNMLKTKINSMTDKKGIRYGKFRITHKKFSNKEIIGCFVTYQINKNKKLEYYVYPKLIKEPDSYNLKIKQVFIIERRTIKKDYDKTEEKILYRLKLETVPSCAIKLINDVKNKL